MCIYLLFYVFLLWPDARDAVCVRETLKYLLSAFHCMRLGYNSEVCTHVHTYMSRHQA
jgi:hypothetical protein